MGEQDLMLAGMYKCRFCKQKFTEEEEFDEHMIAAHSDEPIGGGDDAA